MASQILETRRENGRAQIERHGGVGKVAVKMGYANPSFLVQIFGPSPTRTPTEKTARRLEEALHLPRGALDGTPDDATPRTASPVGTFDADMLADIIRMVDTIGQGEAVKMTPNRFASVTAMAMADGMEHQGQPRESYVRSLVRLLKG